MACADPRSVVEIGHPVVPRARNLTTISVFIWKWAFSCFTQSRGCGHLTEVYGIVIRFKEHDAIMLKLVHQL
ncbi:hypothetical protein J6590_017060 [Homalodisca vitripennis]|nr:hypothetical protein J6590_017060 [Homalodisca vitripennis]